MVIANGNDGRFEHVAAEAAQRFHFAHPVPGYGQARPRFRAGQVDCHPWAAPASRGTFPRPCNEAEPDGLVVMGGVDAHHVHAAFDERIDETGIPGRAARHGHHDACIAIRATTAEQACGAIGNECGALVEVGGHEPGPCAFIGDAGEITSCCPRGDDRAQYARFETAE